jgi:phosphomannomutase
LIASVSGIRGVLNQDLSLADVVRFSVNFARVGRSKEVLLARDTRGTGPAISRAVAAAMMGKGINVVDLGVVSTPALFRESLLRGRPAVMVTASHNEPEFNGLKFIVDGKGLGKEAFDQVAGPASKEAVPLEQGQVRRVGTTSYVRDLVERFGEGSCDGVRVALDLGGGAAISHAVPLLRRLGCLVTSVNDTPGVFNRRVDPTADELVLLRKMAKSKACDVGFGFDCDGDRLVIVDDSGNKRTGDYMLSLAFAQLLPESGERALVVSVDTTMAVDLIAKETGAQVFRTKVGEANVVSGMVSNSARFGGEGSSGGLIDGSFNYCRDSLLAAITIVRAIRAKGTKVYGDVKTFQQSRVAINLQRQKALKAIRVLASETPGADTTDGVKIWLSRRSWVLIRASGTEDLVRISAEAETASMAAQITRTYSARMKELCR